MLSTAAPPGLTWNHVTPNRTKSSRATFAEPPVPCGSIATSSDHRYAGPTDMDMIRAFGGPGWTRRGPAEPARP